MRIGNVEISSQLALGPMAGVTDTAFRQICAEMGAAGALRGKEFSTEHYYAEFVRIAHDMIETGGAL